MQSPAAPSRRSLILAGAWLAATLTVLTIGFREALFLTPPDAEQGDVGRIFYWHVPSATLALIFPYINFIASLAFLYFRRRNPARALTADAWAIAAAEISVVFASIGLVTGMLWGRAAWGIWWAWDWRLTSFLLLWLIYVAYLMTRRLSEPGQTGTLGAIISVFAAVDVPIVYFSIRWFRTQHPAPVFGGGEGSGMDASMMPAVIWNAIAWLMWGVLILAIRVALERRRQSLAQAAALDALNAPLAPSTFSPQNHPEPGNAF